MEAHLMPEVRPVAGAPLTLPALPQAPAPPEPASGDQVDLSPEGQALIDAAGLERVILLKMALEGKDYQTARKEALEQQPREQQPGNAPDRASSASASPEGTLELEFGAVQATRVTVDAQTPAGSLHVEVVRVEALRVEASLSGARKKDPLLVDLSGTGPDTTGAQAPVAFDLEGNGDRTPTSFVQGGSAFLALDRNGNGTIDSGLELFGDQHGAEDGYAELAKFDADGNGSIDARDPVFGDLRLLHGDGQLSTLAGQGIVSLSLGRLGGAATTAAGDDVLARSTALRADGGVLSTYAMGLQRFDSLA